jgi:hypothetical protein
MSPITTAARDTREFTGGLPAVRTSVLTSLAILLAATLAIGLVAPKALLLPSLALAATLLACAAGAAAQLGDGRFRARAMTAAGVFAFAAAAAAMLGDPDLLARAFG